MSSTGPQSRPPSNIPIARFASNLVYENPFVSVHFDPVRFSDGTEGRYTRIKVGTGNGVAILPVRGGLIGLVRQYRYPVGRFLWEAPRGFAISNDPKADAAQELREETGATGFALSDLGVVHPDTGILEATVSLFLARIPTESPFSAVDEVDDAAWVTVPDLESMIADGEIADGFTLALVARARFRHLI